MVNKFPITNILLGVTGSVGSLAVPEYIILLRENVAEKVYVMMSHSAKKFYYKKYQKMIPFDVPIRIEFREPFMLVTG